MSTESSRPEYLVLSRGKWDPNLSPDEIQAAIDKFYVWLDGLVQEGKMKPGQRLAREGKVVTKRGITDGPFAEGKEVIGGYWFIVADSLDDAAALIAANPCISCGLVMEVRPLELERASASALTNETPER